MATTRRVMVTMAVTALAIGWARDVAAEAERPLLLKVDCLTATAPAGWTSVRSLLGAATVIQSLEQFETNGLRFRQKFSIAKMPARGRSLEEHRDQLLAVMVGEQTRLRTALSRARPSVKLRALEVPEVVRVDVAGTTAWDWTIETLVEIEGQPLPFHTRTRLILFRDIVYAVVAGVDAAHADRLASVVEAFLSSVRLDGRSLARKLRYMAVDLMVMPLSRYWSGDYVTPAMRFFWKQESPYVVFTPSGTKALPPGQPYGGTDAHVDRERLLERTIPGLFSKLARVTPDSPWDEHTSAEPCFYRPSNAGMAALMDAAVKLTRPKRRRWSRAVATPPYHLALAAIHLPMHFPNPLDGAGLVFGSLFALEVVLTANAWPPAAVDAVESFEAAISDAKRLSLPLVVDS
jgi:hypothetical protein